MPACRAALLWPGLLLAACAPRAALPTPAAQVTRPVTTTLTPRPPGSPDVVIFAVSGRCAFPCSGAPQDNWDYLTPRGTVAALASAIAAQGVTVETHAYSAHLLRSHLSRLSHGPQPGFVQLDEDLRRVQRDWVQGRRNPSRIVLLAHSHGTNWTHQLARFHPETPVALAVDLDGICAFWESDNRQSFAHFSPPPQGEWLRTLAHSCDLIWLKRRAYRAKDIAWDNIRFNLEVQSKRFSGGGPAQGARVNPLFELTPNTRLDGTRRGIQTFVSGHDDHSATSRPGSEGMNWLLAQVRNIDWRDAAWEGLWNGAGWQAP